jgi:hypothetical protein
MIPTRWVERLALRLGQAPQPVLDTLLAPLQARALMAAQRAGVLARLDRAPAPAATLARELGLDAECLTLVLRVLCAMGYVVQRGTIFRLSALGRRHFGARASAPFAAFVDYGPPQWTMIEQLDDVLRTGRGIDFHDRQTPDEWDAYQRAMFENAQSFAAWLTRELPVRRGAEHCSDLAGAHGYVGAALCRKHRGLRSTVYDRAEALPRAAELARQHHYDDVVRFEAHDIRHDALAQGVDVSLLCNILHHFPAPQNRAILQRVRASMRPGGTVAVFEIETPHASAAPEAASDGFALYFRISSSSTCFRGDDYAQWLREAGFVDVRAVRSVRLPSRVLVVGRVR